MVISKHGDFGSANKFITHMWLWDAAPMKHSRRPNTVLIGWITLYSEQKCKFVLEHVKRIKGTIWFTITQYPMNWILNLSLEQISIKNKLVLNWYSNYYILPTHWDKYRTVFKAIWNLIENYNISLDHCRIFTVVNIDR